MSHLAERFWQALDHPVDKHPVTSFHEILDDEELQKHAESQQSAMKDISKFLALSRNEAKQACSKLTHMIEYTHSIGVPKGIMDEFETKGNVSSNRRARLDTTLTCSQRGDAVEWAIQTNKRIALDVVKEHNLEKLARDPHCVLDSKITSLKSNLRRDGVVKESRALRKDAAGRRSQEEPIWIEDSASDAERDTVTCEKKRPSLTRGTGEATRDEADPELFVDGGNDAEVRLTSADGEEIDAGA